MLKRFINLAAVAVLAVPLVACGASTPQGRFVTIADMCDGYTGALNVLAIAREDRKLTAAQIRTIDRARGPANAICSGPAPLATSDQVAAGLAAIKSVFAVQKELK